MFPVLPIPDDAPEGIEQLGTKPAFQFHHPALGLCWFKRSRAARRLWLHRLGAAPSPPADLFSHEVTLEDLPQELDEVESAWSAYLAGLTDAGLARTFDYQSMEGPSFRNTVEDVLTQMFGHSWYHRGQIALLLRSLGCQPAVTDLVFWAREAIPPRAV